MFFTNKWANLALIAVIAGAVAFLFIHMAKVVDKNGKDGGLKLSLKPAGTAGAPTVYA